MSRDSSHSRIPPCSSGQKCANTDCPYADQDPQVKTKSLFSVVKKTGLQSPAEKIYYDECLDFVNQKLTEAEHNILSKENLIVLLQGQLEQLKDRNIKSINETHEVYYKYGVAQQELLNYKHICAKYDEEIQKLRSQQSQLSCQDQLVSILKEEAERWKKQYEDLATKISLEGSRTEESEEKVVGSSKTTDEEKWRSVIQNEVQAAVNILKENSQVVISTLEKQNKKLETNVEKLQKDLDAAAEREESLQNDLHIVKNKLAETSLQSEQIKSNCCKEYEENMKALLLNNEKLKAALENMTQLYTDIQTVNAENVMKLEDDLKKSEEINEELNIVKYEFDSLTKSLSIISEEIVKAKENALLKNEELRQQVAEMGPSSNMKQFVNKITESLEGIEMTCDCLPDSLNEVSEQVTELNNSIADVEKINKLNFEIELKLQEIRTSKKIDILEEDNIKLKENMAEKCDNLLMKIKESAEKIEIITTKLHSKNDVIQNQNLQISNLNDIIENEKQKNDMLESDMTCVRNQIQKEKTSNIHLSQENKELQDQLDSSIKNKKLLEEEYISIKSSLIEMENVNEELQKKLQKAIKTTNEMKILIEESQSRIENLEKTNQELKETVKSLKNVADDSKINNLVAENQTLKQQIGKEKENIFSLKKHIDSLQFYHENQMKANTVRLEELYIENNTSKINLQSENDKLSNMYALLEEKLEIVEEENKQLQININELNTEIDAVHEKLQKSDILQDPQKYVIALSAMNLENIEMKTAMKILREILEVKLAEKVNSDNDLLEAASTTNDVQEILLEKSNESNEEQNAEVNLTEESCGKKIPKESLVQRVKHIEKKIDELVDNVTIVTEEIKSTSMPNLDESELVKLEPEDKVISAKPDQNNILRKSTSLDSVAEKLDKQSYESNWEKQLETVHKLRIELTEILEKIDLTKESLISPIECMTKKYTDKYKEIITNLQLQINELQQKSAQESCKNVGLQEEIKGIKGQISQKSQIEEEVYKLRKELYKQKVESIKESEVAKMKRDAELSAIQQKLKCEFLVNKQKLLSELAAVQFALQVKHEEEIKVRNKCDELVKEVTANQQVRKQKLKEISLITAQPVSSYIQNVVYEVPDASRQNSIPQCSKYPEKPVKPHALVINARKKLNTLEKHRLSSESVPEPSNADEELKKKYLLQ